ncbi:Aste57867_13246 [Aphanomyces stellatus]|uniref:Aste57867_13246 protein n=1 Tax=Aphanomyces stellatus TaxID=120398 RepID=A0A485KY34_9STRA|nr:hypothetical protein As57867_013197 [Aphanomyces stellatus]VFT90086.1 Aste57867_13246 [Aphanomyces stellatus]
MVPTDETDILESAPPVLLGLTLGFFKHLVTCHGGRDVFLHLTTEQVCNQFVKPYTRDSKLSLVDHVHRNHPNADQYVREATWFVSHAWNYMYLDVVDALTDFFDDEGLDSDDVAVWFCMFNNNQHLTLNKVVPFEYWVDSFQSALKAIGKVVMVLSPWNNPTTLTRTWCVFELYVAIKTNARFEVAMGKPQKREFLQDIMDDSSFLKMLATIKSDKSQTSVSSDRESIVALMTSDNVTFATLDRMLFDVMDAWILRTVQRQIDLSTLATKAKWLSVLGTLFSDKNVYEKAKQCFDDAGHIYELLSGQEHPKLWLMMAHSASISCSAGDARDVWQPRLDKALTCQVQQYGKDNKITLEIMYLCSLSYNRFGENDIALPLAQDCFERCNALFGDTIDFTLQAMQLVGRALLQLGRLEEAEWWTLHAYKRQRESLGPDHPNTQVASSSVTGLYRRQGKYALALPLARESYDVHRRTIGLNHLDTWMAYCSLGTTMMDTGDYASAKPILVACVDDGIQHTSPAVRCMFFYALGKLHSCLGETDRAQHLLTKSHQGFAQLYPPTHPYCRLTLLFMCLVMYPPNAYVPTLPQLTALEEKLKQADMFHETWVSRPCQGCSRPIQGIYVECPQCPKYAWFFCEPCVAQTKHKVFCTHDSSPLVKLKPPARFLQEKRLMLLADDANWIEYDRHFQAYEAYCTMHQVPQIQRKTNKVETCRHWQVLGMGVVIVLLLGMIRSS